MKQADLYLVPDCHLDEYREWLLQEEGQLAFNQVSGTAAGADCFLYDPAETYRLYPGAASVHLEDGLARRTAELLLTLLDPAKEETT